MNAPDQCASCGAGLAPGTRFCRACGNAVEATEANATPGSAGRELTESCPSCAAEIVPGSSFCHGCGASLGAPEPPPSLPPQRPSPPAPQANPAEPARRRSRGPLLAAAAFAACLALGGLVAGGVYLLTREDDSPADSAVKWPALPDSTLPTGVSDPRVTGTETEDPSAVDADDSSEGQPSAVGQQGSGTVSSLTAGRYIQAGSFRSPEGAGQEVERLREYEVDAVSLPAAWANELLPGFHVLLVGPLSAGSEEDLALRRLARAGVSGWGRYLTPTTALSGPEAVAGTWAGDVEQSSLRGPRRRTTYRIEIAIDADGGGGTIEYPERRCSGELSLIEDAGYSLAYEESIQSGGCPAGGVWHLRPTGGVLTAVRLHDDREVMVEGDLPAG